MCLVALYDLIFRRTCVRRRIAIQSLFDTAPSRNSENRPKAENSAFCKTASTCRQITKRKTLHINTHTDALYFPRLRFVKSEKARAIKKSVNPLTFSTSERLMDSVSEIHCFIYERFEVVSATGVTLMYTGRPRCTLSGDFATSSVARKHTKHTIARRLFGLSTRRSLIFNSGYTVHYLAILSRRAGASVASIVHRKICELTRLQT